ncbi:zinc finger protein [Fusarium flagelliforme]|uniref:Zinc finger protein n=1 Tax=Fusarium flagelliforme TaxID=2675880 RepID=A0A395MRV8_9HYPO|nr:zinc finger protein [Fusarium flagelliforme]
MAKVQPPASRKDFRVAIICALPHEIDAVILLFDHFWDDGRDRYGRADGDTNTYITGCIGKHNVVVVMLLDMGTVGAAAATACLRSSYTGLKLAILVGICGGVPYIDGTDAFLGDVVISKSIVQYDYGRQYPGHFAVKNTVEDRLGRANSEIRTLLAVFETDLMRERLQDEALRHLEGLQEAAKKKDRQIKYQYPGAEQDKLFPPTYTHRHRGQCSVCANDPDSFCEAASEASCAEAECDVNKLVVRDRSARFLEDSDGAFIPEIFIGRTGSGDTVIKSGEHRDRIAATHNLIAFDMDGVCAGAWDQVPCIVVQGICDYADSHKSKGWQAFAAATAASVMKAIVGRYVLPDEDRSTALTTGIAARSSSQVEKPRSNGRRIAGNSFGDRVWINQGDVAGNVTFM